MAADWDRVVPLASIRRYFRGQLTKTLSDRLYAWYDVLLSEQNVAFGSDSYTAAGETLLEWIEDVGLVNHGFLAFKDTRLTNYTTSGGNWEELRPASGAAFKYRLWQTNTAANLAWSATSKFALRADPEVAFTLKIPDTPPDHDSATYPPFVRIEFGGSPAFWALEWSKIYGGRLMKWTAGAWRPFERLPDLEPIGDSGEALVVLRCLRGRILVSTNRAVQYDKFEENTGAAIAVASGPVTFRGRGNAAGFGLHQLEMAAGIHSSPSRGTGTTWLIAPTPTITGRTNEPTGTSISFADASAPASGIVAYTATLTPHSSTPSGAPWAQYKSPELYAVLFRYPVSRQFFSGLGLYETPWDGSVYTVDIDKPFDLDQSSCDIEIRHDPDAAFSWDSGRWPALRVMLGYTNAAGGEFWWTSFTGFAELIEVATDTHRDVRIRLRLHNTSCAMKLKEWTNLDRYPLGGQTVNAALDAIMDSEGLLPGDRLWHVAGNLLLPFGSPEDPFEWPPMGESKWVTMVRLAGYAGLELGVLDDGRYVSLPRNYYDPYVSGTFEANPSTDLAALVQSIRNSFDSSQSATCVLVYGTSESGEALTAFAVDGQAEQNSASPRFSGVGRVVIQEEVPGTTTLGLLVARAAALAQTAFENCLDVEVHHGLSLHLSRRVQLAVTGEEGVGVGPGDRFALLTLKHHVEHDPSFVKVATDAGLRRLN